MEGKKTSPITHNHYPIILGIDPGYGRMGLALVQKNKSGEELLYSECFETSSKFTRPERLVLIANKLKKILAKYRPTKVAVEDILFSKNVKTAIGVAEARGVILAEVGRLQIPIFEFNPNSVKLTVTGYGRADKKQTIIMLNKILKINRKVKYDDEYDAMAVALTGLYSSYPQ